MKFKIMLLFLVFNFNPAICGDGYHKQAAAESTESVSCGHVTPNPTCLECGIAASNAGPSSEVSFATNACVHTSDKNYCLVCNPASSSNSSSKASDNDKSVTIEPMQCQQHIYDSNGYCITCKKPGQYERDVQTSNGIGGGGGDENIASGSSYKKYFIGGSVLALAFYLWKSFR